MANKKWWEMVYSNIGLQLARAGMFGDDVAFKTAHGFGKLVRQQCRRFTPILCFVVKQLHENKRAYHFHVLIVFKKKIHTTNPDFANVISIVPFFCRTTSNEASVCIYFI